MMRKLLLLIFIVAVIIGCKKDGEIKVIPPIADSIYLVSTVTESNPNLVGTETFTYNDQHSIMKDVVINYAASPGSTSYNTFYTFIYNTDGTLASVYSSFYDKKYDFTYQNGSPIAFYQDGYPNLEETYTTGGGNVTRIDFPKPDQSVNTREYMIYAYDTNNNITGTVLVNKYPNASANTIDSIRYFITILFIRMPFIMRI